MDFDRLLKAISQLESSGGTRREHEPETTGLHKGTRSISSYGLMPKTIWEMAQRNKEFQGTPIGKEILSTKGNPEIINQITFDPERDRLTALELKKEEASRLAPYLSEGADPTNALLYAHRKGVSGAIKALQGGKPLEEDPYVKAGRKLLPEEDEAAKMKMELLQSVIDAAKQRQ